MWATVILAIAVYVMVFFYPVIHIWVIRPHKSLKQGLRDWVEESEDDV